MQRTAEFIGFCGKKYLKQPQNDMIQIYFTQN